MHRCNIGWFLTDHWLRDWLRTAFFHSTLQYTPPPPVYYSSPPSSPTPTPSSRLPLLPPLPVYPLPPLCGRG